MAEKLVKNLICSKCGLEARPNAAFCFSCGGEIIESENSHQAVRDNGISSAWFKSDITADESQKLPPLKVEEDAVVEAPKPEVAPEVVPKVVKAEEKGKSGKLKSRYKNNAKKTGSLAADTTTPLAGEAEEPKEQKEPKVSPLNKDAGVHKPKGDVALKSETSTQEKLKSAASIRQKSKLAEKKRVEVVWAPPEGAPNIWFVAVSIVLTIFAVGVFIVMSYIR